MKAVFSSNLKYMLESLFAAILWLFFASCCLIVQICATFHWGLTVGGAITLLLFAFEAMQFLLGVQNVSAEDDVLIARNLFGKVETIEFAQIQRVYLAKVRVFYVVHIMRPVIVISKKKTKHKVEDCYAQKGKGYIVIPDIAGNREKLSLLYEAVTGTAIKWQ